MTYKAAAADKYRTRGLSSALLHPAAGREPIENNYIHLCSECQVRSQAAAVKRVKGFFKITQITKKGKIRVESKAREIIEPAA